jgi:hypothetical protein
MGVDELAVIHPVQVIAGENEVIVRVVPDEMTCRLPDGVGGSLIPVRIVGRLLGMRRYLPPIGTAGFERVSVNGKRRLPWPPPRMIARTSVFTLRRLHQ